MRLRLGTRGSALALAQSRAIAAELEALGAEVELVRVETEGDREASRPFAEIGAFGVFVRALEGALCDGRVDLAVHSYKDLPSRSPEELVVAAVPRRADPRDRLIVRAPALREEERALPLAPGARVGTASARRAALLADLRPDLVPAFLRGNVDTRLARLAAGDFDAILLAAAGLDRLLGAGAALPGDLRAIALDPLSFVPAPAQGALALQVRADDAAARALVARLDDADTRRAVAVERRLLELVEAGCQAPFGAHARLGARGEVELAAALERGGRVRRVLLRGSDGEALAREALRALDPEAAA